MIKFKLKDKLMSNPVRQEGILGLVNGYQFTGDAAKGVGGFIKNTGLTMTSPVNVVGSVADRAKGKIQDVLDSAADTAKNYTPTVQNAYLQKSYGAVQAVKEIATGVGKGIFKTAMDHKGTLAKAAALSAAVPVAFKGVQKLSNSLNEARSGDEKYKDGMSTTSKAAVAAGAVGTGAYMAGKELYKHNKTVNALNEVISKGNQIDQNGKGLLDRLQKAGIDWKYKVNDIDPVTNKPKLDASKKPVMRLSTVDDWTKAAKDKLGKMNGKTLGISNKALKVGGKAALGTALVSGVGYLANKALKNSYKKGVDERRSGATNPNPAASATYDANQSQKEYSYFGAAIKLAKKAGGIESHSKLLPALGNLVKTGNFKSLGKFAGTAAGESLHAAGKSISNLSSLGTNNTLYNNIIYGLNRSGDYGKKAAEFLNSNGVAKGAIKIGGGVALGGAAFKAADAVGNAAYNGASSLLSKKNPNNPNDPNATQNANTNPYNAANPTAQ